MKHLSQSPILTVNTERTAERSFRAPLIAIVVGLLPAGVGCAVNDLRTGGEGKSGGLTLPGVTFKTVLQPRFVGAQNNGGGAVSATATVAQGWETFSLDDINGGEL